MSKKLVATNHRQDKTAYKNDTFHTHTHRQTEQHWGYYRDAQVSGVIITHTLH